MLDEYGGTDAIVSHEDLIEELLGMEIEDEMDQEEEEKLKIKDFLSKYERPITLLRRVKHDVE